ncbi:MAG: radical SAM/SPASM domain-containing protein [Desulfatiglandales bacterium]
MYFNREDYRKAWESAESVDPPIPLNVDIELSSLCNARCPFCHFGDKNYLKFLREKSANGISYSRLMPTEIARRLIDECAEIGVPALKMNVRGESTLHPDYSEIIRYAAEKNKFYDILVNTNGDVSVSAYHGLVAATKVMISLDSLVLETYKRMRPGLNFENVLRTVRALRRSGHPNLWVRRVVTKQNKDEDFISMCKTKWPGINVSEHACFDRNPDVSFSVDPIDPAWPRRYCVQPSQRLVVRANGDVVPCCVVWNDDENLIMGHWPEQNLLEIWNGEKIKALRGELKAGFFRSKICADCTSFSAYDRPEREFLKDKEGVKIK